MLLPIIKTFGTQRLEQTIMYDTLSALVIAVERTECPPKNFELDASEDVHTVRAEDMFWKRLEPVLDLAIHALVESKIEISESRSEIETSKHCIWNGDPESISYFESLERKTCGDVDRLITKGQYQSPIVDTVDMGYRRFGQLISTFDVVRLQVKDICFIGSHLGTRIRIKTATELLERLKHMRELRRLLMHDLEDQYHDKFVLGKVHRQGQEEIHAGLDKVILTTSAWR